MLRGQIEHPPYAVVALLSLGGGIPARPSMWPGSTTSYLMRMVIRSEARAFETLPGYRVVRDFMAWSCSPVNLAISRIVVFTLLATLVLTEPVQWYATLPDVLMVAPSGMAWAMPSLPRSSQTVTVLGALAVVASALTIVGWRTRWCAWIATVSGLVVLTLPQVWGKVNHYHHVLWFAALIAASPSGDAWALDVRGRGRPANSPAYGFPLRCIGLLLGLIYFFPGLWKLNVGPAWVVSDNLRNQMWAKWMDFASFHPLVPADHWPLAWKLGAAATIAFELSFIWLILWRRTRPFALLGGVAFHLLSAAVMGIHFWVLYPCYAALVDWGGLVRPGEGIGRPVHRGVRVFGAALVSAVALAGVFRLNSYPLSVYPMFASLAVPVQRTLELEFVDGNERTIPTDRANAYLRDRMGGARLTSVYRRMMHARPDVQGRRAEALADVMRRIDPRLREAALVRVWQITRSTNPADHRSVLARTLEATIRLAP